MNSTVADASAALPKKIDATKAFEWRTDNSPEMLAQGFTHCFLLTFRDEKGARRVLVHPEHEKCKKLALQRIAGVLVVDYWTK